METDSIHQRFQETCMEDQDSVFSSDEEELIRQYLKERQLIRRNQHQEQEDPQQDYKMKIDMPTFSGKLDLDWIKNVESFFEYI